MVWVERACCVHRKLGWGVAGVRVTMGRGSMWHVAPWSQSRAGRSRSLVGNPPIYLPSISTSDLHLPPVYFPSNVCLACGWQAGFRKAAGGSYPHTKLVIPQSTCAATLRLGVGQIRTVSGTCQN